MKTLRWITNAPLYVWGFTAYPILYLYAHNMVFLGAGEVLRVLGLALLAVTAGFAASYAVFKNAIKAAVLATILSLLVLSYGHLYNLYLDASRKVGASIVLVHIICAPILIDGFVLVMLLGLKYHRTIRKTTQYLNATALLLLVFVGMQIVSVNQVGLGAQTGIDEKIDLTAAQRDPLPDIYYVILDAYSRADWLQEAFGYDNTPFLDALAARGFYVAERSCSNYGITNLSIPSSLNMLYFDANDDLKKGGNRAYRYLILFARENNRAAKTFSDLGYTYVQFLSGFPGTDRSSVKGLLYDFGPEGAFRSNGEGSNPFMNVFLPTTLYLPFFKYQDVTGGQAYDRFSPRRVLLELDQIKQVAQMDEPTFTFVHLMKPHYPFSFDAEGNILTKPSGWEPYDDTQTSHAAADYVTQVEFINQQLLDVIDSILASSSEPPIIVLQGDHSWQPPGSGDNNRLPLILNAYLVPEETRDRLYPTITPVNTFRLILDTVFGTTLGLLPDHSYIPVEGNIFKFEPLTGEALARCTTSS